MWKSLLDRLQSPNRVPRDQAELATLHGQPPIDLSAEYPTVPPPDRRLSVGLLAAQWVCSLHLPEDMPDVAVELLEANFDSPSLRRLAGEMAVQSRRGIENLVEKVFRELSVPYPIVEIEAREIVVRQIAREVIAGIRNPWAASFALERCSDWGWRAEIPALYTLYFLNEELDLDCGRTVAEITNDLIDTFAELGAQA